MRISDFDYVLPEEAIAQTPTEPRDASRLLVATTLTDHRFSDLPSLLDPGDLLVVNDTRVRAARLHGHKQGTGGAVELLLLERRGERWTAMVRPARRLRAGSVVEAGPIRAQLESDPKDGIVTVTLDAPGDIEAAVASAGRVPLPPYITTELADPERYQTVYASVPGSAAAPTAGLHFTPGLLERLSTAGIDCASVELRVGLATFRPISTDDVSEHQMHEEWIEVPQATVDAIGATKGRGGKVVAVGTTVVRALETAALSGRLEATSGPTDLFITPGFRFRVVDRLITNFHMPRSSLVVMVAAFMGPRWRRTYEIALEREYRFLSFGDAMLADREEAT